MFDLEPERPGASEPDDEAETSATHAPAAQPTPVQLAAGPLTGATILEQVNARLSVVRERLAALREETRALTEEKTMLERITGVIAAPTTPPAPEDRPS